MKTIIISYPRSGKSYLQSSLTLSFSRSFEYSHLNSLEEFDKIKNYDHVIGIVRDPLDSISSIVTMQLEFFQDIERDELIELRIKDYIVFYSFILKNNYHLINFNDIANNLSSVINYVSKITGYAILNPKPKDIVSDLPSKGFLKTSRKSDNYNIVRNIVKQSNLDECIKLYNTALERCVKNI